ncbi:hypothetical protein ScPMuIL_010697 [Solemya velum]
MGYPPRLTNPICPRLSGFEAPMARLRPFSSQLKQFHQLIMPRGKHGFGFTVPKGSPVSVGHVSSGSCAEKAGLQTGDRIVRVNGTAVSSYSTESVIKLINQSWKYMELQIQRKREPTVKVEKFDKSPWRPFLSRRKRID